MTNQNTFGLDVSQPHITAFGSERYSIRSRDLSEVRAELMRRGENHKGVAGPISIWFFRESLDAMFVNHSQHSGIWIQFPCPRDFDEMNEYLQQMQTSKQKEGDLSEIISEIAEKGYMSLMLANPPYGF